MSKLFFAYFFFNIILITGLFSQTATTTIYYSGALAQGCCPSSNVCGTDYWCINNTGGCGTTAACENRTFSDPVPAGNVITNASVSYYGESGLCASITVNSYINGVFVGTTNPVSNCTCGLCDVISSGAAFGCTGISGYSYGGTNTLMVCPSGSYCPQRVEITFTYSPGSYVPPGPGTWTWDGSQNTNWFDPCNWNKNSVPNWQSDVVIPGGTPSQPTIASTGAQCNTLTVVSTSGAVVTITVANALTITQ